MNDQEKCIKLAEFVGWKLLDISNSSYPMLQWQRPDGQLVATFDPFTDATDCSTVIKHLNGLGWHVEITHYAPDHAEVSIEQHPDGLPVDWEGDNWMHGVCELALKVIE